MKYVPKFLQIFWLHLNFSRIINRLADMKGVDPNEWPYQQWIIIGLDKPDVWAELCKCAAIMTSDDANYCLLRVEQINGLRRCSLNDNLVQFIADFIEIARKNISNLNKDDNAWKVRSLELLAYHAAIFAGQTGSFEEEARNHRTTQNIAETMGDESGTRVANYFVKFAELKAAIVNNTKIKERFSAYLSTANNILRFLKQKDVCLSRQADINCHLAFFSWLIEGTEPLSGVIEFLTNQPQHIEPGVRDARILLQSIVLFQQGEFQKAFEKAVEVRIQGGNWFCRALLIQYLALKKMNKNDAANEVIEELKQLKYMGYIARAAYDHDMLGKFLSS